MIGKIGFIGGANNVGKTTIIDRYLLDLFKEDGKKVKSLRTGIMYQDECKKKNLITQDEEAVSQTLWDSVQRTVSQQIIDTIKSESADLLLINTHYASASPFGYLMGLDINFLEEIGSALKSSTASPFASVMLIDATLAEVLSRCRSNRVTSGRYMPSDDVRFDLELNRLYSYQYFHILTSILGQSNSIYSRYLDTANNFESVARAIHHELNKRL